jgi:hypothetical protein
VINLYDELAGLVRLMESESLPYALCGGMALAVHGAPRATKDIDLIARRDDEAKVRKCVAAAGYPFEALPMEFSSGIEVQRWSRLVDGRLLMLDFLWVTPALEAIWSRRLRLPFGDGDITVVSRDDLITLKLTAGRPQDLVDIQTLSALEGRHGRK